MGMNDGNILIGVEPTTTQVSEDLIETWFGNDVSNRNIIKIDSMETGQYFQGLLYVKKSNIRQNKHNNAMYDLRMLCVDGNGVIFTATCFNVKDKFTVENKVIEVSRGIKVENFHGSIFYNIDSLTLYNGKDIPITAFIKTIDRMEEYSVKYEQYMKRLLDRKPLYLDLINEVNKKIDFKTALLQSPYKTMIGNKLGSAMKMLVESINLYEHLNTCVSPINNADLDFFILVITMYFVQPTVESYNMFHGSSYGNTTEDLKLPVEPFLMNLIYGSPLSKEEKTKILSILLQRANHDNGSKLMGRFPLEITFFNVLRIMEDTIKLEELPLTQQ